MPAGSAATAAGPSAVDGPRSFYSSVAGHAAAAWSTAGLVLTGAYFTYAYRHSLGRLASSPLMARVATKSVYDDRPAAPDRPV